MSIAASKLHVKIQIVLLFLARLAVLPPQLPHQKANQKERVKAKTEKENLLVKENPIPKRRNSHADFGKKAIARMEQIANMPTRIQPPLLVLERGVARMARRVEKVARTAKQKKHASISLYMAHADGVTSASTLMKNPKLFRHQSKQILRQRLRLNQRSLQFVDFQYQHLFADSRIQTQVLRRTKLTHAAMRQFLFLPL